MSHVYTAFCQEADGTGTIWVDTVTALDIEEAQKLAVSKCARDWEFDESSITCIGLAAGDIEIVFWEDIA